MPIENLQRFYFDPWIIYFIFLFYLFIFFIYFVFLFIFLRERYFSFCSSTHSFFTGKNHTDAVMEDMFSGNNTMLHDVVQLVLNGWEGVENGDEEDLGEELVDNWRIVLARYVNPF